MKIIFIIITIQILLVLISLVLIYRVKLTFKYYRIVFLYNSLRQSMHSYTIPSTVSASGQLLSPLSLLLKEISR